MVKKNSSNNLKTLKISEKTHQRLLEIGNKSQTFDEVIDSLIDFWLEYKGVVEKNR